MGNVLVKAAATDMALQWTLFLLAAYFKTEKFYDLAGSSTFILLLIQSIASTGRFLPRQVCRVWLPYQTQYASVYPSIRGVDLSCESQLISQLSNSLVTLRLGAMDIFSHICLKLAI